MFSEGGVTSPDIWIVISIIIIALISIVLNPLVFRHNFYKKKSIARDLYLALSVTDFVTSLVVPTVLCLGILSPKEEQCFKDHNEAFCNTTYYKYNRTATSTEKVVGGMAWSLGFTPFLIVAVLSFTRWYQISFPLRILSKRAVGISLASVTTFTVAYVFFTMHVKAPKRRPMMIMSLQLPMRLQSDMMSLISGIITLILTVPPNIAAALTIRKIAKAPAIQGSPDTRARKIRSAFRVLLLNVGVVMWNMVHVCKLATVDWEGHAFILTVFTLLSTIQSTYDPIVYMSLADLKQARNDRTAS